jgi:hypothetical protein
VCPFVPLVLSCSAYPHPALPSPTVNARALPSPTYLYTVKLVNSKLRNSKFHDDSNFSLNLHPKEERFIQIYLVILKNLVICNLKEKSAL